MTRRVAEPRPMDKAVVKERPSQVKGYTAKAFKKSKRDTAARGRGP